MSGLTKEQLKNELINHGVTLPAASARKEEYVKLYEQYVTPIASSKGDFSSDEEESQIKVHVTYETDVTLEGVDISTMNDDDLYQKLKELGVPVGPVVDSTRAFYQRKLASLLGSRKGLDESRTNGQSNGVQLNQEEFSDNSDVEEVKPEEDSFDATVPVALPVEEEPQPTFDEPPTAIRKRVLGTDLPATSLTAQPLVDRQGTPIPRPSIRSVTSSATSHSFEPRRLAAAVPAQLEPSKTKARSKLFVYLVVLLVLAAISYFAYQYVDKATVLHQFEKLRDATKNLWREAKHVAEEIDHAQPNPAPEF